MNKIEKPTNLDLNFFRESLENGLRESEINVCDIHIEMGSGGGDNYCSCIYRVVIKFQRKQKPPETLKVIVKNIRSDLLVKSTNDMDIYLKEKVFYYDVLPVFEIMLNDTKIGAKCLYTTKEPIYTFVFEDLKELGYTMANRQTGLDEVHCKMVMQKLGKFHAISKILAKKKPSMMSRFNSGLINPDTLDPSKFVNRLFSLNFESLLATVEKWEGFESIYKKLQKYYENMVENLKKCVEIDMNDFNVLCHGDMWVNNLMFKYEENTTNPIDILFVDFQFSIYTSPGNDINYFLNTSVELSVLQNHREDLIRTYYNSLTQTLEDHQCDNIPSFDVIRDEVKKREGYGFFASFAIFPIISMDKESSEDSSLNTLQDGETHKKLSSSTYSSSRFQNTMKYSLKRFDELGVFD